MAKKLQSGAGEFDTRPLRIADQQWDEWLDGRCWEFVRGVDFRCPEIDFTERARRAAYRRGKLIRHRIMDGKLYLQAIGREVPDGETC